MARPPAPGQTPTSGLLKRSQRALLTLSVASEGASLAANDPLITADTLQVADGSDDSVAQLLLEEEQRLDAIDRKQDFLFLIAGANVGQERFVQAIDTICENTEFAAPGSGSFPLTLVPAQPSGTAFAYHVGRAVTLNEMLAQSDRFKDKIIGGEAIGLLLITSRKLRDQLAQVDPNLAAADVALHPVLPDLVDQIDADPNSRYIGISDVKLWVVREVFPRIAALQRTQRGQIDELIDQMAHPVMKTERSDGRFRGSDPPLRELSTGLANLCAKLGQFTL